MEVEVFLSVKWFECEWIKMKVWTNWLKFSLVKGWDVLDTMHGHKCYYGEIILPERVFDISNLWICQYIVGKRSWKKTMNIESTAKTSTLASNVSQIPKVDKSVVYHQHI